MGRGSGRLGGSGRRWAVAFRAHAHLPTTYAVTYILTICPRQVGINTSAAWAAEKRIVQEVLDTWRDGGVPMIRDRAVVVSLALDSDRFHYVPVRRQGKACCISMPKQCADSKIINNNEGANAN